MKVLFLLMGLPHGEGASSLYLDLAIEFQQNGHEVYVIAPTITGQNSGIYLEHNINVLRVQTFRQNKIKNVLRKGIAQIILPIHFKKQYKKHLRDIQFDLLLMPTPPITLVQLAKYIKKQVGCKFYLILRDIYPQGAADLGLIRFKIIYQFLKYLEKDTYKSADIIGCMSQGNIDYISKHNSIDINKLVLLPNWQKLNLVSNVSIDVRVKYNIADKYIVLFGGTIGYAQKVENIIFLARQYLSNKNIVFFVIGDGVKKDFLIKEARLHNLDNITFIDTLPRDEYMSFVKSANIGLITIDERFTVPTIPSKTTSYLSLKLPILAIIDKHTDYGKIIDEANAGLWSVGGDTQTLLQNFDKLYENVSLREQMGDNGYKYFINNLTSDIAYSNIMNSLDK